MDVSFIIVNYNTTELTIQCIRSIQQWTKQQRYEIIVVDNASPDRSIIRLNEYFPQVRLLLNPENAGFGRANNIAMETANGKYFFLINSDTYLLNDAVSVFWNYMEAEANVKVGSCGGELFYPDGTPQMSFGNFPSILEAISLFGLSFFYKRYFHKHISGGVVNYSDSIKEVDYITGAGLFIRASVLKETGMFDPDFFMYFEETELAFRMKIAGYRNVFLPEARIVHLDGASQEKGEYFNFNKIRLYEKSRALFFKKCYGSGYATVVKWLYAFRNLALYCLKAKKEYLSKAKIVWNS